MTAYLGLSKGLLSTQVWAGPFHVRRGLASLRPTLVPVRFVIRLALEHLIFNNRFKRPAFGPVRGLHGLFFKRDLITVR